MFAIRDCISLEYRVLFGQDKYFSVMIRNKSGFRFHFCACRGLTRLLLFLEAMELNMKLIQWNINEEKRSKHNTSLKSTSQINATSQSQKATC